MKSKSITNVIELLYELIGIPSVRADSSVDPRFIGEKCLAEYLAEYFENLGFAITWDERESDHPNIIATYGSDTKQSKTIMFESHLDTVGITGMQFPPFKAFTRENKIYGRGACDTKGPMAAAMWALGNCDLAAINAAGYKLMFIGAMGEEQGNEGAHRLVAQGLQANTAIILEPTDLDIVHTHKGALWFKIKVTGKAVHGSKPELGLNAISAMRKIMAMLEEQCQTDQAKYNHKVLGKPTLSINKIQGGVELNMVPAECSIEVDRRPVPGENLDKIIENINQGLENLKEKGFLKTYNVETFCKAEPFFTPPEAEVVVRLKNSCEKAGENSKLAGATWYSDAGPFAEVCEETVVFGPGRIEQAHTSDEYIEINSLESGVRILENYLNGLTKESKCCQIIFK